MGVFNGAAFLQAQLDSIAAQSHRNWHLVCSDDHSSDESVEILQAFATQHSGKVTIKTGPGLGFAANFLSLIREFSQASTYICFADQDDIWEPNKIARALAVLGPERDHSHLYCGRRMYWYARTGRTVASPKMHRPCTLRNALIENVASGNTIMLNPAAAALAQQTAIRTTGIYAHDWWLYLIVTSTGGEVSFDNGPPKIKYRQHDANVIGAGIGISSQIMRKLQVLQGAFSRRIEANLKALLLIDDVLTPDARLVCAKFAKAREARFAVRLAGLVHVAPYRQRRRDTLSFWGAASLGCI